MLFYLAVAAGGALGSVSRAWLAILVARLTGPQFPWGTILINIVGSFIIGFFGALTVRQGRFAVPAELQAFVMIGICGGFTTFSSFSLQTFELARDGRTAQALGNVGLSVTLCLCAVAAGHYSANAFHRTQPGLAMTRENGMIGRVIAVLNRPKDADTLLDAGSRILEITGGGHLRALAIRLPPVAAILPSEEVLTADHEAALRAEQENWSGLMRDIVATWSPLARRRGVQTEFVDLEGDAAQLLTDLGRRADIIVASRPAAHQTEWERAGLHAALFDTGTPMLLMPPRYRGTLGQVAAIAWRCDERAEKAVRDCLPILRKAGRVHVLSAIRSAEAPAVLQDHGVAAHLHDVPDGDGPAAARILAMAHELGADLLVMGAYAHGEWREYVFGGVTRFMLSHADLPLFMRH